ncbi:SNF2 family N-terminal domain-containing protein [Nemania sp. NC0429]|nr:SNF2 family N-terminal domain-containing protein [Nemania sp. NC0429]
MDWQPLGKRSPVVAELSDDDRPSKRIWHTLDTTTLESNLTFQNEQDDDHNGVGSVVDRTRCVSNDNSNRRKVSIAVCDTEAICYGALCDAKVKLDLARLSQLPTNTWEGVYKFEVYRQSSHYSIRFGKDEGNDIGLLDLVTAAIVTPLQQWPEITLSAILESAALKASLKKRSKGNAVVLDASLNIIGPEHLIDVVGNAITRNDGHLQHPYFLPSGIQYLNPHYLYPRGHRVDLGHLIGPQLETQSVTRFAQELGNVFASLTEMDYSAKEFDALLNMAYEDELIITELKRHQTVGVNLILAREDYSNAVSAYQNLQGIIGSHAFDSRPTPSLGGINADVMGLGKTLTMLSAIVCTLKHAREFSKLQLAGTLLPTTRATLVVASSPQVMNVWISEINRHLKAGLLDVSCFHGNSRTRVLNDLREKDIVLTTYHTLMSDGKARRLLQQLTWFRIVLDEAHWIRNSKSQQFKAACSLSSSRRWCLTGTPIQNSLDDLRSLLEFLNFAPFSQPSFFRQYILGPLENETSDRFRNLQILMRTVCFRRTSELLSLPATLTEETITALAADEQQLYQETLSASKKEYDEILDMRSTRKKYSVLFSATMKLRRLCNHGTFKAHEPTEKMSVPIKKRSQKKSKAEEELPCAYCDSNSADVSLLDTALDVCPECSRVLNNPEEDVSRSSSPFLPGTPNYENSSPNRTPSDTGYQPLLSARSPLNMVPGVSSKLSAVVDMIGKSPSGSKHLVFTSWLLTLDILEYLLAERGIMSLRMDGQTPFPNRQSILATFCESVTHNVLLLSITTGAVGLTLTVANHVHIVEPQWNPLVEEQAIGRAVRIGQERHVRIYKYITRNSVEQNIATLQKKKHQLAKVSLDACGGDQGQQGLEDLLFIIQRSAA